MSESGFSKIWSFRNSWKAYIGSLFIASLLGIIASALSGGERSNLIWTFWWVFLTIKAWQSWKFKAFIPYPLMVLVGVVAVNILNKFNVPFWPSIITLGAINIGGLCVFEMKLSGAYNSTNMPIQDSAQEWYYAKGDQKAGPLSVEDLSGEIKHGRLTKDSLVWVEGMDNWLAAQETEINKLFPSEPPPPARAPSPPPIPHEKKAPTPPAIPTPKATTLTSSEENLDPKQKQYFLKTSPSGMNITMDGKHILGKTPFMINATPGEHVIDFYKGQDFVHGEHVKFESQRDINIDLTDFCVDLGKRKKAMGTLIKTKPSGLKIKIDGGNVPGTTPLTVKISSKDYSIKFYKGETFVDEYMAFGEEELFFDLTNQCSTIKDAKPNRYTCLKCLKNFESVTKFCPACRTSDFVADA